MFSIVYVVFLAERVTSFHSFFAFWSIDKDFAAIYTARSQGLQTLTRAYRIDHERGAMSKEDIDIYTTPPLLLRAFLCCQ